MSIKDCRGDLDSIWGDGNMENGTTKTNQNEVLKIAEDEATESINWNKIKRSGKMAEKGLQYKLDQLKINKEKINASCSGIQVW